MNGKVDLPELFEKIHREMTITAAVFRLTNHEVEPGGFGPCPICGSGRFQVGKTDKAWTCWSGDCHKIAGRDALGLTAAAWKVGRVEAAKRLTGEIDGLRVDRLDVPRPKAQESNPRAVSDEPEYQAWITGVVEKAQAELWTKTSEPGRLGRLYLHRQRGLSIETMKAYGLGVVSHWRNTTIHGVKIHCAPGVLIPWTKPGGYAGGQVRSLPGFYQITDRDGRPKKYQMISGSRREYLYPGPICGWDCSWAYRGPLLITEGEFDCLLAQQELAGLVAVKTLGGAAQGPGGLHPSERAQLLAHSQILLAVDNDRAGDNCRAAWRSFSRRVIDLELPAGKDLSEAAAAGVNIRDWFIHEVERLRIDLGNEPGCYDETM